MNEDIFEITRDPIDKRALKQRLLTGAAGAVVAVAVTETCLLHSARGIHD
ncbi:MAG: hypothetical protein HYR56_18385 [Acidobacteria bacterium]|nr:hypothetical protein [Acidobacteriota bacterium]MBI3428204.1 hypothetical protein [Acidobacteriota bacterium]